MSTSPDDIDALFDTPAPATQPAPAAAPLPDTAVPFAGVDQRREHRIKVSWPARMQLPGGRVVELRVRDLSDSGVGLVTDVHIPPGAILKFAMGVPDLDGGAKVTAVSGTLRTAYVVLQGREMHCAGTWVALPEDQRELLGKWIRKRRK